MASHAPRYLISRALDPVFGIAVGVSAAGTRIRREEAEQGRGVADSWALLKKRINYVVIGPEATIQQILAENEAQGGRSSP